MTRYHEIKEIEKGEKPKEGLALFLEIGYRDGWDIVKATILCVTCCIPIVTIPVAFAALHTVVMRMIRQIPGDWAYDFKHGFRANAKQAYLCVLPAFLLAAALIFALYFYTQRMGLLSIPNLLCVALLVMLALAWIFLLPQAVVLQLRARDILKNAVMLGVGRLLCTLPVLLLWGTLAVVTLLIPAPALLVWCIFSLALGTLVGDFVAWSEMEKHLIA